MFLITSKVVETIANVIKLNVMVFEPIRCSSCSDPGFELGQSSMFQSRKHPIIKRLSWKNGRTDFLPRIKSINSHSARDSGSSTHISFHWLIWMIEITLAVIMVSHRSLAKELRPFTFSFWVITIVGLFFAAFAIVYLLQLLRVLGGLREG